MNQNTDPRLNQGELTRVTDEHLIFSDRAREIARGVSARVDKSLTRDEFLDIIQSRIEVEMGDFRKKKEIPFHEQCEPFSTRTLELLRSDMSGNWESAR